MSATMSDSGLKYWSARAMAALNTQCRYDRSCFLIGHMRCGSTALSAILVSRSDLSGYGEAHIAYRDRAQLGLLAINQWKRGAWNRRAHGLFDKILHDRYDSAAPDGFFSARAVFMAREPLASIRSIRQLFETIGSGEYASDEAAADYYSSRLETMLALWPRFGERRIALTYEELVRDPDNALSRISHRLGFSPPLANRYKTKAASQARGAGDPINAARYEQIMPMPQSPLLVQPDLADGTLARASAAFARFCALTKDDTP